MQKCVEITMASPISDPFDFRKAFRLTLAEAFEGAGGTGGGSGSAGSGDANDDDDEKKKEETGASGTDDSGGGADESGGTAKDSEKQKLINEAKRHRLEAKTHKAALDEAAKKLREYEDKDKSELEKATRDLEEKTKRVTELEATVQTQAVELAFFKEGFSARFKNPKTAMRLLDFTDLKIDEDGKLDAKAMKDRVEDLLKAEPYLSVDDESDDGKPPKTPSGNPSNAPRSRKTEDDEKLRSKFPALRGR